MWRRPSRPTRGAPSPSPEPPNGGGFPGWFARFLRSAASHPTGAGIVDLLTPTDVRRLLDAHGLAPRKAAGQNFVCDPNTVRKIVRDAGVDDADLVVEIGPGLGSLTIALAQAARRVVAVEIDAGLVRALGETLAGLGNVEVVHADALRIDLDEVAHGGPAKLVANLPYNVATPIVMHALEGEAYRELFVMVQKEVGERWAATVGDGAYGGVSVKLQLVADVEVAAPISRQVFFPVPNVDSVVVRIVRRDDAPTGDERARIVATVDAAFAQRRKTLRNNLRRVADAEVLARAFDVSGTDPGARAEELGVDDFVRLSAALAEAA